MAETHHNPLAQFEVHPLLPLKIWHLDLSFTNASLWMTIALAAATFLMFMGMRECRLVPGRWQSASELLVQFVSDTVRDTAGGDGLKYFPMIFSLFLFILTCNLLGMAPYSFTVTSHIIVTFALAICVFLGCTALAVAKHGPGKFLHFFLPHGIPLVMAPMMFVIELMSYMARPISLSLRLAINMMVGHTLMKVIAGFVFMMGVWGAFPIAFLVLLTGFEIGIALLQAYIFTILTCVYLNDALHLH
ncbi:MAG: F0F1 ATP synthase subunit A [Pseudomonadota bacterium]|nr:F0F1 ATP synthase subunit A [Pseudomonadota bacterium]